ncbi:MAG TPA: tetratricopeptide repeat protein [Candidatus Paceibacterota bacterium]|nr:tetratricopeptide repeat protein [Verrucomicrobiota bacterium]HRY46894.1 tetratricopeptide repeat protein [Candidatus Paceibacterota bacterium]HSA02991.1 tetratricopeptide repeat protein [Candidatus Paceibacterota bacterium]
MISLDTLKSAAEENDTAAQFNLAVHYLTCASTDYSSGEALHWMQRAAERGHPQAQVELGKLYMGSPGVAPDLVEAYRWIETAYVHHVEKVACEPSPDFHDSELALQNLSELKRWLSLQMTLDQIIEGQRRAISFLSKMKDWL